ncbi:hypothetical protein L226DRAFT_172976 [Lentinus tigrinus ALCF2SS1-7]|uniref:uncharacterized protein n=1 Tax=Lentinus tigrinus ALCF2SS1-7 TaxID=1328758 RepID=UPI001166090F|nr:hypothetical protein L226DRAFT_172976 [Lentinus tigrinus ALCF2SS1-7]
MLNLVTFAVAALLISGGDAAVIEQRHVTSSLVTSFPASTGTTTFDQFPSAGSTIASAAPSIGTTVICVAPSVGTTIVSAAPSAGTTISSAAPSVGTIVSVAPSGGTTIASAAPSRRHHDQGCLSFGHHGHSLHNRLHW